MMAERKSISRELLERDPKGLSRFLICKVLNSLADKVEGGGQLSRTQQEFLLKAYTSLEEGELTESQAEEKEEALTLEDLKGPDLRLLLERVQAWKN